MYPEVLGSIEEEDGNVDSFNDASKGINGDEEEARVIFYECVVNPEHAAK